jgi:hypothetical protein
MTSRALSTPRWPGQGRGDRTRGVGNPARGRWAAARLTRHRQGAVQVLRCALRRQKAVGHEARARRRVRPSGGRYRDDVPAALSISGGRQQPARSSPQQACRWLASRSAADHGRRLSLLREQADGLAGATLPANGRRREHSFLASRRATIGQRGALQETHAALRDRLAYAARCISGSPSKRVLVTSRCRPALPTAHRSQTSPSLSGCGVGLRPRSGPACGSRAPREPKPPTNPTRLVRKRRGKHS